MEIDKSVEYSSYNPKEKAIGLFVLGVISLAFIAHFYYAFMENPDAEDWITAVVFVLFMASTFGIAIWSEKKSVRHISADRFSVTLTYKDDKIQIGRSQVREVKTRQRKENGKIKGTVKFVGSDGNKYSIRLMFEKSGGEEMFEWFKSLENEQRTRL